MWYERHGEEQDKVGEEIEVTICEKPDRAERPWLTPDVLDFVGQSDEVIII